MDKLLYVAASGARQVMEAQAVNANNLANATTTGFQADLAAARAYQLQGQVFPSRVYAESQPGGTDFSKGAIQPTGRDLDVAVDGQGWIAVQAPDGGEAYTRAGNLRISPTGMLETGAGHPVMGEGGPMLLPDAQKVEIAPDGTVSMLPVGQDATVLAVVGRIKVVNPDPTQLQKDTNGLLRMSDGSQAPASNEVKLVSGALENSNVNMVDAMTTMIGLSRQFEANIKLMETARENDSASAQLMRMS